MQGARVLDVGAGSGILAIAAAKLWPRCTVLAVDNDPIAVAACAENAAANQLGARVGSEATPLAAVSGQYPLVLANIQAHVLRELRAELVAHLDDGATLVLSGLLTPQAPAVAEEYVAGGLALIAIRPSPDDPAWSSVVLQKP